MHSFKKVAKSLLKRFKTSIRLWSAYSQLEWLSGNLEAARNVFCTALGMSKGFPEAARRDTIVLWTTWIWAEMSLGQYDEALRLVLSIESGKPVEKAPTTVPGNVPGSVLLKARRVSLLPTRLKITDSTSAPARTTGPPTLPPVRRTCRPI